MKNIEKTLLSLILSMLLLVGCNTAELPDDDKKPSPIEKPSPTDTTLAEDPLPQDKTQTDDKEPEEKSEKEPEKRPETDPEGQEEPPKSDPSERESEKDCPSDDNGKEEKEYRMETEGRDKTTGYYTYHSGSVHAGTDINYAGNGENAKYTIVIDAGHQLTAMTEQEPNAPSTTTMKMKVTGGTVGKFTKIPEYELNLTVALLLRDELISRGYSVVMVRETNDVRISNIERAQIANKYHAAVNIRIHANGADDTQANGALGICQTASNRDNGNLYPQCRALTDCVLSEFCNSTGMKKGSIWETDTMTGINWAEVPSTILEMGFMTNQNDDEKMATQDFRITAAKGIADGIEKYLTHTWESQDEPTVTLEFEERNETVTATGNVWIRTEPSTDGGDATKYKVLKVGESITRTGYTASWSRVLYDGKTYYVSSKYLQ